MTNLGLSALHQMLYANGHVYCFLFPFIPKHHKIVYIAHLCYVHTAVHMK